MTFDKKLEISEKVEKYLRENKLWASVEPYLDDLPVIEVDISWGDWKHEHLRCRWLLEEVGVHFINTLVTEENGSDCYSARHRFYVTEESLGGVAA